MAWSSRKAHGKKKSDGRWPFQSSHSRVCYLFCLWVIQIILVFPQFLAPLSTPITSCPQCPRRSSLMGHEFSRRGAREGSTWGPESTWSPESTWCPESTSSSPLHLPAAITLDSFVPRSPLSQGTYMVDRRPVWTRVFGGHSQKKENKWMNSQYFLHAGHLAHKGWYCDHWISSWEKATVFACPSRRRQSHGPWVMDQQGYHPRFPRWRISPWSWGVWRHWEHRQFLDYQYIIRV